MFIPLNNLCTDVTAKANEATPADVYNTDTAMHITPGKENIGRIDAISVETGDTLWSYEQKPLLYAPIMTTGGDLLFAGSMDRYFRALDQSNGEVLWETRLPSQVSGHPVAFEVDGKQYIAITAGGSLIAGYVADLNAGVDTVTGSNGLFVFALPEE
jgi:alcohol dehydrogenase (cytochrome c)